MLKTQNKLIKLLFRQEQRPMSLLVAQLYWVMAKSLNGDRVAAVDINFN